MANLWNQEGIPHKGWLLINVIDLKEEFDESYEIEYEHCMMCGHQGIRYVHLVVHEKVAEQFRVGCDCAEKMTNDYLNPEKLEKELRNRANRKKNWVKKEWKTTINGNHYLKIETHFILIYIDKKTQKYKVKIDETFGKKEFVTLIEAKIAAFNGIEYFKKKDSW
jgi:hypothetical protein